ncbi:MAG: ankyrin repeat domain-containing protein [Gemmatimonadetes bacterium]|nr:ankyrin repeat domain-containing protein [Gemmatimonadota bacterium]
MPQTECLAETHALGEAIVRNDRAVFETAITTRSELVDTPCRWIDRRGRERPVKPLVLADMLARVDLTKRLLQAGADIHDLDASLFGCCEGHDLEHLRRLLAVGVNPSDARNDGWDCDVLYGFLQTYTRSSPDHLHTCINLLIDHGAAFEDGPVMDIHRGDLDGLAARLEVDAGLVSARFALDYGSHLTLRGSTLLHVAVEFHELEAIALLLKHGADLNARVAVGRNGVGGHTPLFHAIGTNQGTGFHVFEQLLELKPDLAVEAMIQSNPGDNDLVMDCIHKGKEHFFEEVLELTPLGYAKRFSEGPVWREASRELAVLKTLGAP